MLYDRGRKRKVRPCEVRQLKRALALDAKKAAGDMAGIAWLEPGQWRDYMGKKACGELYDAFSDGELLAILKETAERLGRNPSKKEVFCVYRVFLIERFGNWPKALVAAGLKRPRRERREALDYYTMWLHQIKTPIAAMNLVLQQEELPQKAELQSQLFQIERYVEMVLVYLRMGSESTDYVIKQCDLGEVVRQALHKYAPMFIRKKISLQFSAPSLRVLTDEKWLGFCVEQILSNAVKYTPQGGSVSIFEQGNSLVVQDNGIGISPWDLPRIFEKGFTGENGRLDKRASGIGLYLTKQVLQRLGHGIDIDSRQGFGTRVSLHFYTDTPVLE